MKLPTLLGSRLPIVAAPMAGGPTTVALVEAVATAGGFPFVAGGYKTVEALAAEIAAVRTLDLPFGVNIFVPAEGLADSAAFADYANELQAEADVYGLHLDTSPTADDDQWTAKLALLTTYPVPVVSLTFGLPDISDISALQRAGSRVLATVTTPEEALQALEKGVDGLIVQGADAGGHSATFDPRRTPEPIGTAELIERVRRVVNLPIIGAGGVDGPEAVRRLLEAGALAVAVGTLLLRTNESGASPTLRDALVDPKFDRTVITTAFTGRPARALSNGFTDRHRDTAPLAYPAVHHLTRALRQAANASGDADRLHLWAGTGYRSAPTGSVADVIHHLAEGL